MTLHAKVKVPKMPPKLPIPPPPTDKLGCHVHTRSHEAHDALIAKLVSEKLELATMLEGENRERQQVKSLVAAANARANKAIAELKAFKEGLAKSTDRTTRILAANVLELEERLAKANGR